MTINRREAIQGLGFLGLGFLFRGQDKTLVPEPVEPEQAPSAIDIVARPQHMFRPERVPMSIAPDFVIEDIHIGGVAQFAGDTGVPADVFSASAFDTALNMDAVTSGIEIKFRVRYVGKKPQGEEFLAAIYGRTENGAMAVLPVRSGCKIVG